MFKNTLCIMGLLGLLLPASAFSMETAAKQAVLIEMETGTVLFAKDADTRMHPSSMSKLMTLYVLFQRLQDDKVKLSDRFPVSEKAWRMQGSKTFVHVGDQISVEDLIRGIIIQSGNDACVVVAEALAGSEEAFAEEMNRVALQIGLSGSHFVNSTGWPDEEHVMSARDLVRLSERIILDFPQYYHYFSEREFTFAGIVQHNRNRLLGGSIGVDGLKTGHTEAGGYGIALSARQGERRLLLVINGMESDNARVEEGDRLLRYGFREFATKTLLREGQSVASAGVWFGEKAEVPLVSAGDVKLTLPVSAAKTVSYTLVYTGPLRAPVEKGAHVADLVIAIEGSEPRVTPLMASERVEKLSGVQRIIALLDYYLFRKPQ